MDDAASRCHPPSAFRPGSGDRSCRRPCNIGGPLAALPAGLLTLLSGFRTLPATARRPSSPPPEGHDASDFHMFPQLRGRPLRLRHADRQLPAAAGCLRRPELLRARSERALRDPHRQQRDAAGLSFQFPSATPCQRRRRRQPEDRRPLGGHSAGPVRPGLAGGRPESLDWPRPTPSRWCAATAAPAPPGADQVGTGGGPFAKPVDNIGVKTIPDYRLRRRA